MVKHCKLFPWAALLVLALSAPAARAESAPPAVPDSAQLGATVQEMLAWADRHNPEIRAMQHESDAAAARVTSAGALDDPMFRMELEGIDRDNPNLLPGRVGSTKYTLLQTFPLWGKRDVRREAAEAESDQTRSRRGSTVAEVHFQIKRAFAMYYQAQHNVRLSDEILQLMRDLERIATTRYSHGLAPQQDVIRAKSEQTALHVELIALEEDAHHAQINLNLALNRPPYASLVDARELRPLPAVLDAVTLEQRILANSPFIDSQTAQVRAAEKNQLLVEKNRYPDLTLGISPIQRGNRLDAWGAMLEINIPLQQESRRAREREAAARLAASQERAQLARNQVIAGFSESFQALGNARRTVSLLRGRLLPEAELALQSALAGYQAGKVDFTTLLEAQRIVRKVKQDLVKAEVDREIRRAEIERLLGEEL